MVFMLYAFPSNMLQRMLFPFCLCGARVSVLFIFTKSTWGSWLYGMTMWHSICFGFEVCFDWNLIQWIWNACSQILNSKGPFKDLFFEQFHALIYKLWVIVHYDEINFSIRRLFPARRCPNLGGAHFSCLGGGLIFSWLHSGLIWDGVDFILLDGL